MVAMEILRREVLMTSHKLSGFLTVPEDATGLVMFVHGSGSSRFSPRNMMVADRLNKARMATLLFDLLLTDEAEEREKVFDIQLLAGRLRQATEWAREDAELPSLPLGYFGASTGAGAALLAAAEERTEIAAVVSRGGRPDLSPPEALSRVRAPTLLIVGGWDHEVIKLNERALALLQCEAKLEVVPRAGHLFEESGALERVAALAADWFKRHFRAPAEDY